MASFFLRVLLVYRSRPVLILTNTTSTVCVVAAAVVVAAVVVAMVMAAMVVAAVVVAAMVVAAMVVAAMVVMAMVVAIGAWSQWRLRLPLVRLSSI
jgi:hypothetical protein